MTRTKLLFKFNLSWTDIWTKNVKRNKEQNCKILNVKSRIVAEYNVAPLYWQLDVAEAFDGPGGRCVGPHWCVRGHVGTAHDKLQSKKENLPPLP